MSAKTVTVVIRRHVRGYYRHLIENRGLKRRLFEKAVAKKQTFAPLVPLRFKYTFAVLVWLRAITGSKNHEGRHEST
ncbi:MAG: hypothetical protein LGR52_11125 [Candidatus Thiosymbion ectosymbiont of Robbea hypermnestra]|nr:hypothetical protein [Candidatus Thiosymbion ectosymbiont of Robbea hypermnestra]